MLVDDARNFLKSEKWYADSGIPFRLGCILHGVLGSCKLPLTPSLTGLTGQLQLDIYVVSLIASWVSDNRLTALLGRMPAVRVAAGGRRPLVLRSVPTPPTSTTQASSSLWTLSSSITSSTLSLLSVSQPSSVSAFGSGAGAISPSIPRTYLGSPPTASASASSSTTKVSFALTQHQQHIKPKTPLTRAQARARPPTKESQESQERGG
ncbi:hypothetical protein GALMADRAFT_232573 [Galerina marginata CBS 339.88]|uniref:Uncharacterized protein n=1 Tax=Galerina marginata (strain CBS 339.88) TaxID=685588 RepID=A0A067S664_GALM3|nr:hypothetical protein GALMADRAFT_232573 [Galerina marginata CBS 339.88]